MTQIRNDELYILEREWNADKKKYTLNVMQVVLDKSIWQMHICKCTALEAVAMVFWEVASEFWVISLKSTIFSFLRSLLQGIFTSNTIHLP